MTDLSKNMELALEKLKLTDPLPLDIQKHIRRTKHREFKKTLKKAGGYTALFALIASIFFFFRRRRVNITIIKSAVLLALGALFMTAAVITLLYLSFRNSHPLDSSENTISEDKALISSSKIANITNEKKEIKAREDKKKGSPLTEDTIDYKGRLGIKPFKEEVFSENKALNKNGSLSRIITEKISKNLFESMGNKRVVDLRKSGDKRAGMLLFGSVEILEGNITIHARVVRVSNSKIIYYTSETINSREEIDAACLKISQKIQSNIK